MGNIKLDCLAVNPNNTIVYGVGNAFVDGTYSFTRDKGSLLLVRSEPNPTSFKSIKWTIVSIVEANAFPNYWAQTFDSVDCAVSRTGVFTALAVLQKTYRSQGSIEWTGIKYDPALDVKGSNGSSQVRGYLGWEWFGTGNDYLWPNARSLMSHAAIYYDEKVKVPGGPTEGTVKERFIHAAVHQDGQLRFGSFVSQDPISNNTIVTWNSNNSLTFPQAPKVMSLSQGYVHVYREEEGTITSYALTDSQSYIPTNFITKAAPGLTLKHIIPGVRNGTSFLACISTNFMYFISNYLERNNTIATPITSQIYHITATNSSTSPTSPLRPYLFVTSQYNTTDPSSNGTSPIIQNTFHFGISLSSDGDIYGISLTGNSTSNTFGQTGNAGPVRVDGPYSSNFGSKIAPRPTSPPQPSQTKSEDLFTILGGLAGGMFMFFLVYLVLKRRNRKSRALETERFDASGQLGPIGGNGFYEPARYQTPPNYEPQRQGQGQGQGQVFELTTTRVPFGQQQHRVNQPSTRHDGLDAPPAYSA